MIVGALLPSALPAVEAAAQVGRFYGVPVVFRFPLRPAKPFGVGFYRLGGSWCARRIGLQDRPSWT
jgi:hypothetical protein